DDLDVTERTVLKHAGAHLVLGALPEHATLESRVRELMEVGAVSTPAMRGAKLFYAKRSGTQAQPVILVRDRSGAEPRVILDPNTLDPTGLTSMAWWSPDPQGRRLAVGLHTAGDENAMLHLIDVASGEWLSDEIRGKVSSADWMPDGRSFFYRRLSDVGNPYSGEIRYHRIGRHHRHDELLFEQYREGPMATTWGPFANFSRDGRWMLLTYMTGTGSNDLWVIDLDRWFRTEEFVKREIAVGHDARSGGSIIGDTLYLETEIDAPNGRLVAVDLHAPGKEHWKTLIPERADAVMEQVSVARGILVVTWLRAATTEIERFDQHGHPLGALALPGIGSAGISTHPDRTEAYLAFTSFNTPTTIYRVDLETGEREVWERQGVPVDPDRVVVRQVRYASKDGTEVSMFLVHARDLEPKGDCPTILYGYGGFNVSLTPQFSATLFPWFEAGGVYAVANLRGGGEYGKSWHEAGMLDRKQNVFDDFIAAAEWLISEGITNPRRLAIAGGSNGGLLTGAVMVQRPELFAAVLSAVPLLDMLRYQHFLMARYWVPEYGTAEVPEQEKWLRAYSPYHNVQDGVRYPAVFLTAGENDSRVHPLHARKMGARLQEVAAELPDAHPVLVKIDREAGHGAGKPLDLQIRDVVDDRIFMMWQTGMLKDLYGPTD
ncbi:MAG: S9 family peptidase, partial [Planctomycetes bacterium]|nr:S9 family peptidase [Planctomycetota bacterium]